MTEGSATNTNPSMSMLGAAISIDTSLSATARYLLSVRRLALSSPDPKHGLKTKQSSFENALVVSR
jgi:hypothetical protein